MAVIRRANAVQLPLCLLTPERQIAALFSQFNPNSACDLSATDPATVVALLRAWASTNNWMTVSKRLGGIV